MKTLLLDENLPRPLKQYFSEGFEVKTVPDLGWQSKKNGELLSAMDDVGISFLVTADRNLRFQQNLNKFRVRLVLLITNDTRLKALTPWIGKIESAIDESRPELRVIEVDLRV